MAATKFGDGTYGISDESTKGLYIQALTMSASVDGGAILRVRSTFGYPR